MKKNKFITSIMCLCAFVFAFSIVGFLGLSVKNSYAETTDVETSFDSLYINDLSNAAGDSYVLDNNNNVQSLSAHGRVGFNGNYTNIEVKATLNFSTAGNTVFRLRANGDIKANTFTNNGYFFRWYAHGQYDFVKNGTVITSAAWGPLPAMTADTYYELAFKTVNLESGAVHIVLTISGATFVDYVDTTDPITDGGMFAISSEGSALSAKGNGFDSNSAFDLASVATPFTSSNFPGATINEDKSVVTATNGQYSGVAYAYQSTGEYTIKAKVTPIETTQMVFMIGASKTNSHEVNRPDVASTGTDGWGWDNPGYAYYWNPNGQRWFSRGAGYDSAGLLSYEWLAGYGNNTTYEIEFGLKQLVDGQIRVHFKVNGGLVLNYLDNSKTFNLNTLGGAPASLYSYSEILSVGSMKIEPYEAIATTDTTITPSSLANPIVSNDGVKLDRNGIVQSFTGGGIACYDANKTNYSVKFKANFSTIGTNFVIGIAKQGINTDGNITWTNGGYTIYVYPNSQIILYKNGQKICEGWALGWKTFDVSQDYTFSISITNISSSATLLNVMIDDQVMLNYVDSNNPINEAGWFTLDSNGFSGELKAIGVNIPAVTTSLTENTFDCKDPVTLSYTLDGKADSDSVQYFIDEDKTTATASISGNILTATTAGDIEVYALVNGVYSKNIKLTATKVVPVIETVTEPIIVGGEKVTLIAKMEDDSAYTNKVFSIENGTGEATIDPSSGEITAIKAGTIKVWVTIDGADSIVYTLQVSPKIKINVPYLAVDGSVEASYSANCELPNEPITVEYSIISMTPQVAGQVVAEIDPSTGIIYGKAVGKYILKVIVRGQTFMGSDTCELPVSYPVVSVGVLQDTFVGQTITINPTIDGGVIITSKELIIEEGRDLIEINGMQIKALKAGHVVLRVKINGKYESGIPQTLDIGILTPTIIASDLRIGKAQTLTIMFNATYTPTKVEYSIIKGQDLATITGDTLTALDKTGKVTIKAVVDDIYETTLEINIISKTQLAIANNQHVQKRQPVRIDYHYDADADEEITSVKFVLVSGFAKLTTVNAEDPANCYANLTVYGRGPVKIKVIVNGQESTTQTILPINKLSDWALALIIIGSVVLTAGISVLIIYLVKTRQKRKAKRQERRNARKAKKEAKKALKNNVNTEEDQKETENTQTKKSNKDNKKTTKNTGTKQSTKTTKNTKAQTKTTSKKSAKKDKE